VRAVPLKSLLESIADLAGVQYGTQLSPAQGASLIRLAKEQLAAVWEELPWPDTVRTEARVVGLEWVAGVERTEGDIVVFGDTYYTALEDIAALDDTDDPATATTLWEASAVPFARTLELAESGKTVMGRVFVIWDADPALGRACELDFALLSDVIQLGQDAPARVWVEFQLAPPALDPTPWSASENAAAGAVRYYESGVHGDCYLALETTDATPPPQSAKWERIEIPAVLAPTVKYHASADWLRADGKEETAALRDRKGLEAKDRALQSVATHQRQTRRFRVRKAA
jgi:hypothetical protein